jgi:uncharacterized protein YbaR (Trm112 family)
MPVNEKLLDILCCPKTKVPVKMLKEEQIENINDAIKNKTIRFMDDSPVEDPLEEGLITIDGKTIYRVDGSIPIMLIEKGIPTDQFENLD